VNEQAHVVEERHHHVLRHTHTHNHACTLVSVL
jgi:hypothetical protein